VSGGLRNAGISGLGLPGYEGASPGGGREGDLIYRHIGESAIAPGSRSEDRHRPVQRIRRSYDDRVFGSHDDVPIGRIVLGRACAVLPCGIDGDGGSVRREGSAGPDRILLDVGRLGGIGFRVQRCEP